ncbi:hypothetical protein NDU88_002073 [Pleurodeles waltl]|uniref:Uncharacterized protein n=1 Tax=Pleurodeles waltl TaxID=8319 RepID=A0AAV7KR61_PLEWA|nr:hypothetical protein NDU88_002073 [Pleurodeles waltl]
MTSRCQPCKVPAVGEHVFLTLAYRIGGPSGTSRNLGYFTYFSFVWAIFLSWAAVGLLLGFFWAVAFYCIGREKRTTRVAQQASRGPYGFELSSPDLSYSQWRLLWATG